MFSWLKSPSLMLAHGETYKGLKSAIAGKQWQMVQTHIEWKLQLPDDYHPTQSAAVNRANPVHSELRLLLIGLTNQLIALSKSASDARSPVPSPLKQSILREADAAFDALAQTCERLEVVAVQGVDPARLRDELAQEAANLRQLLEATEDAAAEMAKLTLSAGRWKVSDSSSKFERLGWAARELTQFNRELDE